MPHCSFGRFHRLSHHHECEADGCGRSFASAAALTIISKGAISRRKHDVRGAPRRASKILKTSKLHAAEATKASRYCVA
jgi:hypothetical protein